MLPTLAATTTLLSVSSHRNQQPLVQEQCSTTVKPFSQCIVVQSESSASLESSLSTIRLRRRRRRRRRFAGTFGFGSARFPLP